MVRGLIAVMAVAFGPMLVAYCLLPLLIGAFGHNVYDLDDRLLGLFLGWSFMFAPYMWAYPRGRGRMPAPLAWAVGQWTIVGLVVGLVTRSRGRASVAVWSIVAAVVVACLTHAGLSWLGYVVELDGL
jgi:hypothetical protein